MCCEKCDEKSNDAVRGDIGWMARGDAKGGGVGGGVVPATDAVDTDDASETGTDDWSHTW